MQSITRIQEFLLQLLSLISSLTSHLTKALVYLLEEVPSPDFRAYSLRNPMIPRRTPKTTWLVLPSLRRCLSELGSVNRISSFPPSSAPVASPSHAEALSIKQPSSSFIKTTQPRGDYVTNWRALSFQKEATARSSSPSRVAQNFGHQMPTAESKFGQHWP